MVEIQTSSWCEHMTISQSVSILESINLWRCADGNVSRPTTIPPFSPSHFPSARSSPHLQLHHPSLEESTFPNQYCSSAAPASLPQARIHAQQHPENPRAQQCAGPDLEHNSQYIGVPTAGFVDGTLTLSTQGINASMVDVKVCAYNTSF